MPATRPQVACLLALLTGALLPGLASAQRCEARSGERPLTVVELYTSQGCSSCPPADRWLSGLNAPTEVLALAFHVNYWNHLGWKDPFASEVTTQRQHLIRAAHAAPHVYTPQVVVNGKDHRTWWGQNAKDLPRADAALAPGLHLVREGNQVTAHVSASAASQNLAGYWAVLQDGLTSPVTRGENSGTTLRNDHVVRLYQPVAAWPARGGKSWQLSLPDNPPGLRGLRIAFVVTDASLTRPLQALALRCT
ncbi:DUF1223 domain-containing protein [Hydrogenophaga sp. A37]|uniref:DUF1223 domain-containing protein n=1 Tax=Hydrogenophaga sp. A37 TaxID=1945864 RepID=UPI000987D21F|nr:DUF1223 domain-containing protein [Hydrogenophaga sp. A37]OOG82929.1 hypothetical protein B0E41_13905 [Hydrogenophaga sp. A37]